MAAKQVATPRTPRSAVTVRPPPCAWIKLRTCAEDPWKTACSSAARHRVRPPTLRAAAFSLWGFGCALGAKSVGDPHDFDHGGRKHKNEVPRAGRKKMAGFGLTKHGIKQQSGDPPGMANSGSVVSQAPVAAEFTAPLHLGLRAKLSGATVRPSIETAQSWPPARTEVGLRNEGP